MTRNNSKTRREIKWRDKKIKDSIVGGENSFGSRELFNFLLKKTRFRQKLPKLEVTKERKFFSARTRFFIFFLHHQMGTKNLGKAATSRFIVVCLIYFRAVMTFSWDPECEQEWNYETFNHHQLKHPTISKSQFKMRASDTTKTTLSHIERNFMTYSKRNLITSWLFLTRLTRSPFTQKVRGNIIVINSDFSYVFKWN